MGTGTLSTGYQPKLVSYPLWPSKIVSLLLISRIMAGMPHPLESHPRLRTLGGYLRNAPSSPQLEMAFPRDMMAFVKYSPTVTLTPALHINLIRRSIIFKEVMEGISSSIIFPSKTRVRLCAVRRKKPGM